MGKKSRRIGVVSAGKKVVGVNYLVWKINKGEVSRFEKSFKEF